MLKLVRYDLRNPSEWERFYALFSAYLAEVCGEEEYQKNINDLHNDALNRQMIGQTLRQRNPYFVMQILSGGEDVGIISYSYHEERRCGFINNFYVRPEHRNAGIGTSAYRMAEAELASLGAQWVELIPVEKAVGFYLRNGFAPARTTAEGERVYRRKIV